MWPLCFWLPQAYSVASAPIAAIFVITSKVGIYIVLRLSLLVFGSKAGFGHDVLLVGGLATVALGAIGVLASQSLAHIASFSVIVSSGRLLTAVGLSNLLSGAAFTLLGTIGLLRFETFYERVHAPTLGTSFGTAGVVAASIVFFPVAQSRLSVHEVLIVLFVTLSTPMTLMLLTQSALYRDRLERQSDVPEGRRAPLPAQTGRPEG